MGKRKLTGNAAILAAAICVAAALPSWAADRTINADYTLTSDETVDGTLSVARGATVDLAGHNLTVNGLKGGGNPALVDGRYQILEYVMVNGSQYVQTGYTPLKTDRVEMKLRHSEISTQFAYGTRGSNKAFTCLKQTGGNFRINLGAKETSLNLGISSTGIDYIFTQESSNAGSYVQTKRLDNGTVVSGGVSRDSFVAPPGPLALFTTANYDSAGNVSYSTDYNFKGRFYWFRVYGWDGDIKCDIVPVKDTKGTVDVSDDEIGLYDFVTGTFLAATAGTFTDCGTNAPDAGGWIVNTLATLSELRVNVASGGTEENREVGVSGNIKLVKQGGGTFIAMHPFQTYCGGTDIEAGTLKCGTPGRRQPFGLAIDNLILNGNFDAGSITNGNTYQYTASEAWLENPHWTCDGKNAGISKANGTWVDTSINVGVFAMYLRSDGSDANIGPAHAEQTFRVVNPGRYRFSFNYMAVPNNSRKGATLRVRLIHGGVTNQLFGLAVSNSALQRFSRYVDVAEAGEYTLQFYQDAGSKYMANSIDDVVFAPVLEENNLLKNGSFDDGSISGSYQYASSTEWTENPYWTCDGANVGLSTANNTWAANLTIVGKYAAYLRTYENRGDAWFEQTMHIDDPGAYALWFTCSQCANSTRRNEPFHVLLIHGGETNHVMSVTASETSFRYFGKVVDITEPGDWTLQFRQYSTADTKSSNINDVYFGRIPSLIVRDGATLDVNGYLEYDKYPVVMDGGRFVNSGARATYNNDPQLGKVILSADSTFDMVHSYSMRSQDHNVWKDAVINLGGHELQVVLTNDSFYVENCTITNGTIRAVGSVGYVAFIESSCRASDADLILNRYIQPVALSDVRDLTLNNSGIDNNNQYTGLTTVRGTLKCLVPNFGNIQLMDGATLDLSGNTGTFSLESTAGGSQKVTFENGATIALKLGSRRATSKIVGWTTAPTNLDTLTFVRSADDAGRKYRIVKKDDGIYIFTGFMILVK